MPPIPPSTKEQIVLVAERLFAERGLEGMSLRQTEVPSATADGPYGASSVMKRALHAFTKISAKGVGKHGITVNAIAHYSTPPGVRRAAIALCRRRHAHRLRSGLRHDE